MNKYFKTSDAKNFAFYKVPKALFEEKYKSVSTDAKMLYGLLLDRMYLSVKNGWIVNVNIKMIKKWKIKMYIFQDLFLSLCFHKGSFFF